MNVGIITASDKGACGQREDLSGARIAEIMESHGYTIRKKVILPDDQQKLQDEMIAMCEDDVQLILTTGGTGFSKRDVTPEATLAVCDRNVPGIAEAIRAAGTNLVGVKVITLGGFLFIGGTLDDSRKAELLGWVDEMVAACK